MWEGATPGTKPEDLPNTFVIFETLREKGGSDTKRKSLHKEIGA